MPDSTHENNPHETIIGPVDDAAEASESTLPLPERVGDYIIENEIARGGMGVVYRARHEKLNRTVALKMILAGRFASPDAVRRFRLEAESAAKLEHSGIIPVYDFGEYEGNQYLSMRLVDGGSFADRLADKSQSQKSHLLILRDVANAVHHAHQRRVLHRDLKPENVLIDSESEQPVLTDLGLAREVENNSNLTRSGVVVGTPSYMPPEQAEGREVTTAADIYSLGAILYEVLTGSPPHREDNAVATLMKVVNEPATPPSKRDPAVDRNLEAICMKCLERDPNQRYGSAKAFADDIDNFLEGRPLSVRPPSVGTLVHLWARQNLKAALTAAIVGIVAGLIIGFGAWSLTIAPSLRLATRTYDQFPSTDLPTSIQLLPVAIQIPPALESVTKYGLLLMLATVGFFNALIVRPESQASAIGTGMITGFVAAVIMFPMSIGWMTTDASTIQPSERDIYLLARSSFETNNGKSTAARRALLLKYPELDSKANRERSQLLYQKVMHDLLANVPSGLIMGLSAIFLIGLMPCIFGTAFASGLLRTGMPTWKAFIRYAEGVTSISFLGLFLMLSFLQMKGQQTHWLLLAGFFVVAATAAVAAVRSWSLSWRLPLHVTWISMTILIATARSSTGNSPENIEQTVRAGNIAGAAELLQANISDESTLNDLILAGIVSAHAGNHQQWQTVVETTHRLLGDRIETDVLMWNALIALLRPDPRFSSVAAQFADSAVMDADFRPGDRAWARFALALAKYRKGSPAAALDQLATAEWATQDYHGRACGLLLKRECLREPEKQQAVDSELNDLLSQHQSEFVYTTVNQWHLLMIYQTLDQEFRN